MKTKKIKFILLIACAVSSIMLSAKTNKYMANDTVAVPMATFDSIRGKVKSVVETYYFVKEVEAVVFKKGNEVRGMGIGLKHYYDELGRLTHYSGWCDFETVYIYDAQNRLIITLKPNTVDDCYIKNFPEAPSVAVKTEYFYNDKGKLKETITYEISNYKELDSIKENFDFDAYKDESEAWQELYYIMGAAKQNFEYSVRNNAVEDWGEGDRIDMLNEFINPYDEITREYFYNSNIPRYNAKGEMLLKGHKFKCTFDKYGNWTTKIDYTDIGGGSDNMYLFVERKIKYYK